LFASEHDWPFLKVRNTVALSAATRYANLPSMNFERPVAVACFWNTFWKDMEYGIDSEEFNSFSSGDSIAARTVDPPQRWQFYDETQFEVWPVPVSAFTIRFTGQRTLTSLKTGSAYDTAKTFDLDDMLLVYSVAADKLTALKSPAAQVMAAKAAARFNSVRGSYPVRSRTINLAGPPSVRRRVVSIQVAAP
jgi:hypothetical protein